MQKAPVIDWESVVQNYSPYLAGIPPAVVMLITFYNVTIGVLADKITDVWRAVAFIAAVFGAVGIMFVGSELYKTAAKAFAQKEYGAWFLSTLCGAIVTGLVIWAVYLHGDVRVLAVASGAELLGYVGKSVPTFLTSKREIEEKAEQARKDAQSSGAREIKEQSDIDIAKLQADAAYQTALADARAKVINAQKNADAAAARRGKVSTPEQKVSESFRTDWRSLPDEERTKIKGQSTRWIMTEYKVSERTALNWSKNSEKL